MNKFIEWHNKQIDWWKNKLKVSWYTVTWIAFVKGALLVLLIFMLTGCAIGERKIKIFSVEEPRQKLEHPMPTPLELEKLQWIIINSENADEVFAKLKEQNIDPVLFGLTDDDYEILAVNFAQIRAYMIKQKLTLDQYRKYYESEETIADK